MTPFQTVLFIMNILSFVYILAVNTVYMVQLVSSAISLGRTIKARGYSDHERFLESENMIPISLLTPAYNEEASIIDNVHNLLSLDFPEYEVIVINDGSKDRTLELLIDAFEMVKIEQPIKMSIPTKEVRGVYRTVLHPNLIVVDKENGGKADALNVGINISRYPIFVSIDADSILEKESLLKIIMPFVTDHRVIGVGGIVRIASGCEIDNGDLKSVGLSKNPIVNLQTVEYLRAFLTGRIGFDAMGILLIVSGAFGAFNKKIVIEVGGYTNDTIGEDMELVVKMHEHMLEKKSDYVIKFIPDPVCWTMPPETVSDLRKQRKRWQVGLVSAMSKHMKMLFNPKYGRIGMAGLPYYMIFEIIGPFLETMGYVLVALSFALNIVNLNFMIGFYAVAVLYGIVLSIGSLLLEENTFKKYPSIKQLLKLTFYAIIDNFGYRQINTLFRVEAMLTYSKNKSNWGSMKRKSFADAKSEEGAKPDEKAASGKG